MQTLSQLGFDEARELHARLLLRWRNGLRQPVELSSRQFRMMDRVFTHANNLAFFEFHNRTG